MGEQEVVARRGEPRAEEVAGGYSIYMAAMVDELIFLYNYF